MLNSSLLVENVVISFIFFKDGTKLKITSEIKQPSCAVTPKLTCSFAVFAMKRAEKKIKQWLLAC